MRSGATTSRCSTSAGWSRSTRRSRVTTPDLQLPATVRSRIVKERGVLKAYEVDGPANSESRIELLEVHGDAARYRLLPHTGKTHQLRLHMSSLGIPIHGDNFYPDFYDVAADDYSTPLRLLARSVEFVDPYSGVTRRFASVRSLDWPK